MSHKQRRNPPSGIERLRRKPGQLPPRPSILIVCEGQKTEPKYFDGLARRLRLTTVEVRHAVGTDPVTIVNDAAECKRARAREVECGNFAVPYDEVWCVFDVDEHPKIKTAISTAANNGISVGITNPCFEYWLLLHFTRSGATNLSRHQMQTRLGKYIKGYEKGRDYMHLLFDSVATASKHATHVLRSQWQKDPRKPLELLQCNPSTAVHLIVESFRAMSAH